MEPSEQEPPIHSGSGAHRHLSGSEPPDLHGHTLPPEASALGALGALGALRSASRSASACRGNIHLRCDGKLSPTHPSSLDCYWVGSLDFNFLGNDGVSPLNPQKAVHFLHGGQQQPRSCEEERVLTCLGRIFACRAPGWGQQDMLRLLKPCSSILMQVFFYKKPRSSCLTKFCLARRWG